MVHNLFDSLKEFKLASGKTGKYCSLHVAVTLRVNSPIEVEYLKHGGILPFVLR